MPWFLFQEQYIKLWSVKILFFSVVIVIQSLSPVWFCNSMDCCMPAFPVLHYLPVCSNSCPLSQWCHPTISSSVAPFSSCHHVFPASQSFLGFSCLVDKVLDLQLQHQKSNLFLNILSRFVIAFLPKSKHLLVSWLQSLSAVILEPRKIKV